MEIKEGLHENRTKLQIQEAQNDFPYHHLAVIDEENAVRVYAYLDWGMQYLAYTTYIVNLVLAFQPKNVLDVGCGEGRLLSMLGDRVPIRVGIDLSEHAILFAKAFVPQADFYVGTASSIKGQFDVVVCVETLEHIPDSGVAEFVEGLQKRIHPYGKLVVSVPTNLVSLNPKHFRHYTAEMLIKELSSNFRANTMTHLVRHNKMCYLLTKMLSNRWFIVTWPRWRRFIWRLFEMKCFFAKAGEGEHIVGVFEVV